MTAVNTYESGYIPERCHNNYTSQQIFFCFLLHELFQLILYNFWSLISNLPQFFFLYALVLMQSPFCYSYLGGILYISFVQFRPIASH